MKDFDLIKAFESRQAAKKHKAALHNGLRSAKKIALHEKIQEHLLALEKYSDGEIELSEAEVNYHMEEAESAHTKMRAL